MTEERRRRARIHPPKGSLIPVAEIVDEATAVLQKPEGFCYFGMDHTLWKTAALTVLRHRDSTATENATFERTWQKLCSDFPDLAPAEGADRMYQNPGKLYVFGASHWAVGWTEQIACPVLLSEGPVAPDNIHPAFVRLLELVDALTPPTRVADEDSGRPTSLSLLQDCRAARASR